MIWYQTLMQFAKISSISRVINEDSPRENYDKSDAAQEGNSKDITTIENKENKDNNEA